MSKQTFSRINVDVNSLNVSAPGRSGFDLGKSSAQSIPFGKLYPVRCTKLMPNSTVKGSVNPDLQLEKFATPAAGRMRLDTHTFMVAAKRIHNGFKQFIESGMVGRTAQNLPSFKLGYLMTTYFYKWIRLQGSTETVFSEILSTISMPLNVYNPSVLFRTWLVSVVNGNFNPLIYLSTLPTYNKNIADWFVIEHDRLDSVLKVLNARMKNGDFADDFTSITSADDLAKYWNGQYYLGDFLYDVFMTLFGEGSTLDQLGYPIYGYYGLLRERLNAADKDARSHALQSAAVQTVWDEDALDAYIDSFGTYLFYDVLCIKDFTTAFSKDTSWDVSLSEMPIRANYAVWFDYFRDWHLDPETSCPNPDDFGYVSLFPQSNTSNDTQMIIALLSLRCRNWSRDGFTMVQPDDVYRHVYAPAVTNSSSSGDIVLDGGDAFDAQYFGISAGKDGEFHLPFPSSFINLFGTTASYYPTYYHDLQTMRRAEMLKRKLTRDYYNPDTYVGYHIARWGVEPADFQIVCSQYLGGSESMINGSQVTANMQTADTVLGQRTLVANAASNDSFVYNMGEYAYLISYVSIVPLVHYDALNPTLQDISVHDEVIPEYANDNQVMIRTCDLVRDYFASGLNTGLGYVPRYYGYRAALDDAHGKYLREYRSYVWLRDRKSAGDSMLTKNAINAHVNVALDCFIGLNAWDTVAFGNIQLPLFVECALPDKLENV